MKIKKCPFCNSRLYRDRSVIDKYYDKNRYVCRKCDTLVIRKEYFKTMNEVEQYLKKIR